MSNIMTNIEIIKNDDVYKKIIKDSHGGIMYNVANQGTYKGDFLIHLWFKATPCERESAGGIVRGAIDFLREI